MVNIPSTGRFRKKRQPNHVRQAIYHKLFKTKFNRKKMKQLVNLQKRLPTPFSQLSHIMRDMIISTKGVAEQDYNYNMFRGYISHIRKVVRVKETEVPHINTFKRKGSYVRHWLTKTEKTKLARHLIKYAEKRKAK